MIKHILSAACVVLACPTVLPADSVQTLKSISLDDDPVGEAAEMRTCLADPGACTNTEFKTTKKLSLEDVVNLGVIDRSAAEASSEPLSTIDLEILFAYDSDALTPEAEMKLSSLATALTDPGLDGGSLLFIGHTDAVGSAAYNKALSQRRADAVAGYIRAALGLDPSRIKTVGQGFDDLKTPAAPEAAANRRVQLVLLPNT
ncbi:OmpA family protein [Antarctobacter heliothermus]|uniref:OmpA family protein n=1 Tax=Antarctobacter heliothermus TaxID=74033 RepID=UPI001482B185|nr:OmpA family protein [Antarctobacter heliothermus]